MSRVLIIYPIFTGYTDNPQTFGMLLTSTPIIAFFAGFVVSYLSNKITNERLPIIALLYNLTFQSCYIVLLLIFPLNQTLNVTAIIIIIFFSLISESFFGELGMNLVQRINLDIIPSEYRNSILSVISSILTLLTSILLVILGLIIAKTSLLDAILVLEVIGIIGTIFFAISFILEKHHTLNISQAEQPQFS